ncbi:hypothetical protein TGAM01_v203255 [Trichoderma gamsii]|uniref:Uncharacterized protein n=1 Tax=Trichoderma gamsii TaxID=398673 RepID=A0A2P4ZV07_9HYPO|nr:hypothetical protein TGAM01_v203255 [Trichoderma gamsii]PON28118.1 hypothetical protein TGAM01_v203255 [Trichoderma gamsii]
MSKHASLYELSTPLTTSATTRGEKNSSSSHIRGTPVEADAYISGRHMLPLKRLRMEPRFVVEKVSYSVHVSSCPYRAQSKCCSLQLFTLDKKRTYTNHLCNLQSQNLDSQRQGLHAYPAQQNLPLRVQREPISNFAYSSSFFRPTACRSS